MKLAHVPPELSKRVEATYEYSWMFGGWNDGFLNDETLSMDLRRNLAFHVFGPGIRSVPIFAGIPNEELKCISQKIRNRSYIPGDLIIQKGELADELFVVCS